MSYYNRYRNKKRPDGGSGPANGANDGSPGNIQAGLGTPDAIFDIGKNKRVTVRQFRNVNLIDIREYYMDNSTGEMRPGKKGISLTEDLYDEFLKHRLNIDEALRRLGSKRPRTKTVLLESDDDDDDYFSNRDEKSRDKKKHSNKDDSSRKEKKAKIKGDMKNPAEPSMMPTEEMKFLEDREANATLVVPSMINKKVEKPPVVELVDAVVEPAPEIKPQPTAIEAESVPTLPVEDPKLPSVAPAEDENSSDEEFAKHLDDEMNKADDDVSEEE